MKRGQTFNEGKDTLWYVSDEGKVQFENGFHHYVNNLPWQQSTMATIYHGTIKTVSPFISLPPSALEAVIRHALSTYEHPTGLKLESTEVHLVKDNQYLLVEQEKARLEGVITGLEIAKKSYGETVRFFSEIMENIKYYQEQLENLKS